MTFIINAVNRKNLYLCFASNFSFKTFMTLCLTFMLRRLLRISLWSTVWPHINPKLTRWGRIGSWRVISWWVDEYFDTSWLRMCLNCKMIADEVMQEGQEAASACCSLKAGKPRAAADPSTGHTLINRAPSHRPWSRQAEPAASNLFQKDSDT